MFHPVKRVVRAFWGKLDSAATSLASDEKWSVYLRHGVVSQLLFSSEFSGGPRWGIRPAAVMGECRGERNGIDTNAVRIFISESSLGDPLECIPDEWI